MADDDDDTIKLGQREQDNSGEYLSTQDLEAAVIDLLEDHPLLTPLTPVVSSSQEDAVPDGEWSTPEDVTPEPSVLIPQMTTEQIILERDLAVSEDVEDFSSSIEQTFQKNLISNPSVFSIEKVLGEATANILTEAEAEVSRFANKLQDLDSEWDSETDLTEPHSLLTCRICQLFVRTVDRLLDKSDQLEDHYLPLTEEEIGNLKKAVEELDDTVVADHQMQACVARINNLSGKLRQRAYMMALSKLRLARRNTQESLSQLHQTINLIGQVQHEPHPESHQSYRRLSAITIEWSQRHSIVAASGSLIQSGSEGAGTLLAQTSIIEEDEMPPPQSSIEKPRIPIVEITHVEDEEVESYSNITTPPAEPETMTPPPEISSVEEIPPPPPPTEISYEEVAMPPPAPAVHLEKALSPLDERIRRDVANITITAPGCDEEAVPTLKTQTYEEDGDIPPAEMEAQALAMSRSLAYNLQGTYENLLAHLQDLPAHLREKLYQTCQRMSDLRSDFDAIHNFEELSKSTLNKSFEIMAEAQGSLDELMEYALQSPEALLWLKDHLPVSQDEMEQEQVLQRDGPLPIEGEEVPPGVKEEAQEQNILKIEQTNDPEGCEDDTLSGKEKEVTPSSYKQDLEDILKTQEAYDPQECDDEIPPNKENEEVPPSNKQEWDIMKTVQGYIPKLYAKEDLPSNEEEETLPSVKDEDEMREGDILKLQQAHDPKGCDDGAPPGMEMVAPPSSQQELEDILKIQQAYDPKGCDEGPPPSKEENTSASKQDDWNILKMLQAYVPKSHPDEASSVKLEEVVPPVDKVEAEESNILETQQAHESEGCNDEATSSGQQEDILKIQEAYDPQGCVEGPPPRWEEATPSSKQEEWNILKYIGVLQAYVPKSFTDEASSGKEKQEVVPSPSEKQVVKEESILENHQAYDPPSSNDGGVLAEKEKAQPFSKQSYGNILKIQAMYDPKDCNFAAPSKKEDEDVVRSSGNVEAEDILKIQQAYDPRGCDDETPPRKEKNEVPSPGKQEEWTIMKFFQSYIPLRRKDEAAAVEVKAMASPLGTPEVRVVPPPPSQEEVKKVVPPARKWEVEERDILKTQKAYDPQGCKDEEK